MNANPFLSPRALRQSAMLTYAALECSDAIEQVPTEAPVGPDTVIDLGHPLFADLMPLDGWMIMSAGAVTSPTADDGLLEGVIHSADDLIFRYMSRADAAFWLTRRMALVVALAEQIETGAVDDVGGAVIFARAFAQEGEPSEP